MKIVIIDDEKEFAATLCQRLELRKYEVMAVYSGADGIVAIAEFSPDIVLLDLKMPDMGGLEILAIIMAQSPHIQTIMLTGHGSGAAGEEALKMGALAYMMKPVSFKELLAQIKQAEEKTQEEEQ